ncbi:hypothetical protein K3495_g5995 [Podosphaera aphanis]|nr:hypothetical protein K3495_g5995 [Podosphaera aphanis]
MEKIRSAAENDPEDTLQRNVSRRKGKGRRSVGPQFPSEWASSKEAFLKAFKKFESENYSQFPEKFENGTFHKNSPATPSAKLQVTSQDIRLDNPKIRSNKLKSFASVAERWAFKDKLDLYDLWDIVTGNELKPDDLDIEEAKSWMRREKIARIIIKNLLGPKGYNQVRNFRNVVDLWRTLVGLHESTGAQGKAELIYKFWGTQCPEGASVREHIGNMRTLHPELAELGGGKEGQGPRQIALRKKQEADRKKLKDSKPKTNDSTAQFTEEIEDGDEVFFSSHMAVAEINPVHFTGSSCSYDSWIADSGASTHVANQRKMFESFNPTKSILNVVGGLTASVEGVGAVCLESIIHGTPKKIKLSNVLYVPRTRHCLISGSRLDQTGGEARYKNGKCEFLNAKGELITIGKLVGDLYRINASAILNKSHAAYILTNSIISWHEGHRRLGHLSLTSLKLLFRNNRLHRCKSLSSSSFDEKSRSSTKFGDLTHTDVWGSPNAQQIPGGNRYFILFIDDFTRYVTVKLMKDKASVKQKLINYCNFVNTKYGRWPKEIRADNAAEYEGTRVWLEEKGIELKPSAPYSPQQNGVSERMNRTLLDLARAMKIEKNLPDTLWGEAVLHAAWIRNRSPSVALNNKTPIEIMTQKEPDFINNRVFGETVFVLEEISQSKIGPRARKVTFLGFEDGPKAIRYHEPITKVIRLSRNFNFTPITERISNLNNAISSTNPENFQDSNNKINQEITPIGVENEIIKDPKNQNINFKLLTAES